jgi:hypothetical protein
VVNCAILELGREAGFKTDTQMNNSVQQ